MEFGPRISGAEYDRRVTELQRGRPPLPSDAEELEIRRRELEIAIDYRLGKDFPQARRDELFAAQCRLGRPGAGFALRYLLGKVLPGFMVRNAQFLADDVVRSYRKVLSTEELAQFLDLEERKRPALPVDMDQLKR